MFHMYDLPKAWCFQNEKKNYCVIYAAIAILCQWRSLLTSVVRAWTTRNCQTGSWTLVAVNALGLSEVNRWSVFVLVKSSLSWRRKMGDKEQNIFMAKLAEQAERYEGKGDGFRRHRWVISVTIAYESSSVVVSIRQKAALRAFYYQFDVSTVTVGFSFVWKCRCRDILGLIYLLAGVKWYLQGFSSWQMSA